MHDNYKTIIVGGGGVVISVVSVVSIVSVVSVFIVVVILVGWKEVKVELIFCKYKNCGYSFRNFVIYNTPSPSLLYILLSYAIVRVEGDRRSNDDK